MLEGAGIRSYSRYVHASFVGEGIPTDVGLILIYCDVEQLSNVVGRR